MKIATLNFLFKAKSDKKINLDKPLLMYPDIEILLAMKKRGFGEGKYNGIGGKVGDKIKDETVLQASAREIQEEIGVQVNEHNFLEMAQLQFNFIGKPEWDLYVHVFFINNWEGEPIETEEMRPQWFSIQEIPYNKMWEDDILWLPHVLMGKKLEANFVFDPDRMVEYSLRFVEGF